MLTPIGVFFSFEFNRDKELYHSFFAEAKGVSRYTICNYSLDGGHPPKNDSWKAEAEKQICQCVLMIVVVGQDTHNALGVKEEVEIENRLGKPILWIQPQDSNYDGLYGAGEIIPWKWDKIAEKIAELSGLTSS